MNNWDSLYIYYISGTGNAKACSGWIADEALKKGFKVVVQQIDRLENIKMPGPEENPLIGFAFPTHGFNAAPIMLRLIAGLNHCPEEAIEAAHGMAIAIYILIMAVNTWIALAVINLFDIRSEVWWWKLVTQITSLALTVFVPAAVYINVHYSMNLKPVKYLIRFTSLTALPFWKRYKPGNRKNKSAGE